MLRALFHFARQVGCSSKDKIRVRLTCFHVKVETLDIDLCCGSCLLTESHAFAQFGELGLEVDGQVAWVGQRVFGVQRRVHSSHIGAKGGEFGSCERPVFGLCRVPVVGGHLDEQLFVTFCFVRPKMS